MAEQSTCPRCGLPITLRDPIDSSKGKLRHPPERCVWLIREQRDALVDLIAHVVRMERAGSQPSLKEHLGECGWDIQELIQSAIERVGRRRDVRQS